MRKIGLDVGDKTIGIAVSDPLCITAQGVKMVDLGVCSLIGTRLVHLIFVLVYLCLFVLF